MNRRATKTRFAGVPAFRSVGLGWLAAAHGSWVRAQTIALGPEPIPPLQPPRGELPPTFWEAHGWAVALGALAVLAVLPLAWRVLGRKRPPVPVPPEQLAHAALESLRGRPEDATVLSQVSRAVRGYFVGALALPQAEPTSRELARCLRADERVGPELARATGEFLERCEQRQFAAQPPPGELGAVDQALGLVDQATARQRALLAAAQASATPPAEPGDAAA